jgi:pimeloyl-ACP methyl ester carboxylesterase
MHRVWQVAFGVMLCLSMSIGVVQVAAERAVPEFVQTPCPFKVIGGEVEGKTLICGTLYALENRQDPRSPVIEMIVVILKAKSETPDPDPVLYLEGGPGGSSLAYYDIWLNARLRETRDIILFDQRGTGYSFPTLNCDEYFYGDGVETRECRDRLEAEDIDLTMYRSAQAAQDVGDLITALQLDQVNLFGVSYGTRLALTVMRDRPERVRSVILDGVYPLHVNMLEEQANHGYQALQRLFADCAADPVCNGAYPELESVFYEAVKRLDKNPIPVTDFNGYSYDMSGYMLVNDMFDLLYDTYSLPLLPGKIYAAYNGDGELYSTFGDERFTDSLPQGATINPDDYFEMIDDSSEGLYNSVECAEEVPFNDIALAQENAKSIPYALREPLLSGLHAEVKDCGIWDTPAAPDLENEPVTSAIPTLVLSGDYDPITPVAWGQTAADYLPNSHFYVLHGTGHGSVEVVSCATNLAIDFLADPTGEIDETCVGQMKIKFYVPTRHTPR